jgi:DoxX-like family
MPAMLQRVARRSRDRTVYLLATAIVISESIAGGVLDLARQAPFYPALIHLGYPPYFTDILGTAKLLAAATLLARGLPRLKEWAYAGIMINMTGATASHLAKGDGISDLTPPAVFAAITLLSYTLARQRSIDSSPPIMSAADSAPPASPRPDQQPRGRRWRVLGLKPR